MEIHNMAGHLIRRMNQISASIFQSRMKDAGFDLTAVQFASMNAIKHYPGIDQATVAGLIAYDRATIAGVIDRLETKGLVQREISKRDRRSREVRLTAQGEATLAEMRPLVRGFQDQILQGLDEDERAEFIRLAKKAADTGNSQSRAPLVVPPHLPKD